MHPGLLTFFYPGKLVWGHKVISELDGQLAYDIIQFSRFLNVFIK